MTYRLHETTPPDPATHIGIDQSDQDWLREQGSRQGKPSGVFVLAGIVGALMFAGGWIAGMPWDEVMTSDHATHTNEEIVQQ